MKHTIEDAKLLLQFLKNIVSDKAELIGSFGKGKKTSKHDIDVLIPDRKKTRKFKSHLMLLFNAESCEDTDWGGWYFKGTLFGNVDIFFTTKNFDY